MLRIRLQRLGKKKYPTYRVIISEQARDPQAKALEILGNYNPVGDKALNLKEDRVKHWLSVGAQPSETVANLLINAGLMESKKKKKSVKISKKRQVKLDEKKAAKEEKKKEAAEAKKAEAEAKKVAEAEAKAAKEAAEAEEKKEAEPAPAEETPAPEVEEKKEEEKA